MIRKAIATAFVSLFLATGLVHPSAANSDLDLTPAASAAFNDVGRCLASSKEPSLSVLYLIDTSGSLRWTDPLNERQGILEGSIAELGSFVDQQVRVELAAYFFSTTTQEVLDWSTLDSRTDAQTYAEEIGASIDNGFARGSTDWEGGLNAAYEELTSREDSCKMLVWFTDGGINPDNTYEGVERGLSALCRPGTGYSSLGQQGTYGLMSQFRKAQIPVFGVLYSNLDNAYEYFKENFPGEADDRLAEERWLMSFMRPLVEGRGSVAAEQFAEIEAASGTLECAELQSDGTAPPEQVNGAFLNAADPIALAYQFLKLGTQISGGSGSPIIDGKFNVPPGTAKFIVLVAGSEWSIEGPEGSGVIGTATEPGSGFVARTSAGASSIEYITANEVTNYGQWSIETNGKPAELFLYTGLTFTLDRDRSSKILSEYPNTITGKIIRTPEFAGYEINLEEYPSSAITVDSLTANGWAEIQGIEITKSPSGEFAIANFVPQSGIESLGVLLRLDLGPEFSNVESEFELIVQDKNALARANAAEVLLSPLIGPSGAAEGVVLLEGPNVEAISEFCFAEQLRISDSQTGIEKVDRLADFSWSFTNQNTGQESTDNCFQLSLGEQLPVLVSVRNPTQAESEVVSVWTITSRTDGVDASFEAPLRFSFGSEVQTNQAVTLVVLALLMLLGLLLPLAAMWLLNLLTTRFLDVGNTVKASFPVKIAANGAAPPLLDARPGEAGQFEIGTRDFLNVADVSAPRNYPTGSGEALARIPLFPLGATWYEWRAPEGSRIITHNMSSSKQTRDIKTYRATEINPNMAKNWALVIPDHELQKGDGVERSANLVVFAQAATIPVYEARLREILNSPRLKQDIRAASEAAKAQDAEAKNKPKRTKKQKLAEEKVGPMTNGSAPAIPGFDSAEPSAGAQGQPSSAPNIPGFGTGAGSSGSPGTSGPSGIPGFDNNQGSGGTQKPPWLKD